MKNSAIILTILLGLTSSTVFSRNEKSSLNFVPLDLSEITITITHVIQPNCNGQSSGTASIEASGGKAPYTYNWNTFPNQYESTATGLKEGVYFVYVSDSEGNTAFKSVEIQDPSRSILTDKNLKRLDHLDLTATVKSENTQMIYTLNEMKIDSYKVSDLPIGVHKLIISDSKGCKLTQFIQVFELKSKEENEIEARAEFINEGGEKIIVSELIPEKTGNKISSEIAIKKKK